MNERYGKQTYKYSYNLDEEKLKKREKKNGRKNNEKKNG